MNSYRIEVVEFSRTVRAIIVQAASPEDAVQRCSTQDYKEWPVADECVQAFELVEEA